jgi:putative flippase GtrA
MGLINTIIGLGLIYTFMYFNFNNYMANFLGYIFGLIFSFILHKKYTFKNNEKTTNKQIYTFVVIFLIAYSVNIIILYSSLFYITEYIAQLLAICGYVSVSYLLNKTMTFKKGRQ